MLNIRFHCNAFVALRLHLQFANAEDRMKKPTLRQSQIKDYQICPACYERKHLLGISEPPSSKMTTGSAVDAVMNMALTLKMLGQECSIEQVSDLASHEMDRRRIETYWDGDDFGIFKDDAIAASKLLLTTIVPSIQPVAVQVDFIVETDLPFNLEGTMDYIDSDGNIRDLKITTKQGLRMYSVNDDIQTACYTFAAEHLTGKKPKGFVLDRIARIPGKKLAEYHPLVGVVTEEDINQFFKTAKAVWNGIQQGIFPRAHSSSFMCKCKRHMKGAA
jgi:hypothetical protein